MNGYDSYDAPYSAGNTEMKRQLGEAIAAGRQALASLRQAEKSLGSAKGWGIFDMLGGGMLASLIKRGHMEDAAEAMRGARDDLAVFQRELLDVQLRRDFDLETEGFLSFAVLFFDGFAADFLDQRKIDKANRQLKEAIGQVSSILNALEEKYRTL